VPIVVTHDAPVLGLAAVVYQRIEVAASGRAVATHHDPDAVDQTIWFPTVATTLQVDRPIDGQTGDDRAGGRDEQERATAVVGDALVDVVAHSGLRPDRRYRADLRLHERLDDGTCTPTDVTASTEFDIAGTGIAGVVAVGGFVAPAPGVFVAFQQITVLDAADGTGRLVVSHADCSDVAQTVVVAPPPPTTTGSPTTAPPTTVTPTTVTPTTVTPTTVVPTTVVPTAASIVPPDAPTAARTTRLPRTGSDATATLTTAALAIVLMGAGLTAMVRRPRPTSSRSSLPTRSGR